LEFEFFLEKNLAWVYPFLTSSLILFFGVGHSLLAKLDVPLNKTWPAVELAT